MSSVVEAVPVGRRKPSAMSRLRSLPLGRAWLAAICLLVVLALPSDGYLGESRRAFIVRQSAGSHGFRLAAWEVQALAQKARDLALRPGSELGPAARHDLATSYFSAIARIGELTHEIERIYADPSQVDPAAAVAPLQAELDSLRAEQSARRPAVERILEQQTAAVLEEAGLTIPLRTGARAGGRAGGRVWPPVRFQFTESPLYLIVSERDRIAIAEGLHLDPAIDVAEMERIESQVQQDLDVSALVEGTGGFSSYPTMVIEETSLDWVVDTIAHEWAHTYLAFRPLGWHYGDSGETRTLNETVASIVGDEIGRLVMLRYYPELVRPERPPKPLTLNPQWWGVKPEDRPFEFGPFMRETRLAVDNMLAQGRVTEAEAFMEEQRKVLLDHGYVIRKLNQAYFAFHGSYAVGPGATDPIGGKLRALRDRSASLAEFMQTVSRFTAPADLDAALR